ncbi:MAG: ATP-binding protein [Candidatus Binatia bacterium]
MAEDCYRQLFEHALDGILVCSTDGMIITTNRRAESLLGYLRNEMINCHYAEILFSDNVHGGVTAKQIEDRLLQEEGESVEWMFSHRDGQSISVEIRGVWLEDRNGFQLCLRDVSRKKAAEQQRADFLEMLAHDIRAPLGVVVGYADLLLSYAKERAAVEETDMLLSLRSGAFSLSTLVMNYLDLAKIEARPLILAKEALSLNALLRRVGKQYEREAQRLQILLDFHLQDQLPLLTGDAMALERVVTNLLHNALKFTPVQGRVTIRSFHHDAEVGFTVTDTGPGMTDEDVAVVFEKYRTAKKDRRREGSGLGLFIVKVLVEALGGRIAVDSVSGAGTCMTVALPISEMSEHHPVKDLESEKKISFV